MAVHKYDVVVIGAGPAGMTAATYASRANLSVVMLDQGIYGGQMNNTAEVENYPGFESIMGPELSEKMYTSSMQFGAQYAYGTVDRVTTEDGRHTVHAGDDCYEAAVVIIATGSEHEHLQVPGEDDYQGRGVSYCAVCDGAFFRGEDVVVVGGGDSAVEEGLYLANLAASVTIIHRRDTLKAQPILQARAKANPKISYIWQSEVTAIAGDTDAVQHVVVRNRDTGDTTTVPTTGVFIYIGLKPNTAAFQANGILDADGWVVTDEQMATAVPGIFAVGDVRAKTLRQITTAVGDGGVAGQAAYDYIASHSEGPA